MKTELENLNCVLPPNPQREWREVPGYEGYYTVSNDGHVGSLKRQVMGPRNRVMTLKTRVLRTARRRDDTNGHPTVNLWADGKAVGMPVGRLVLIAFVGDGHEGCVAHPKDGDCRNVSLENLEWTTPSAIGVAAINGGYYSDRVIQRRLV